MNQELINNNYLVLQNLINKDKAIEIAHSFVHYCDACHIGPDFQVEKSQALGNYLPIMEILCDKVSFLNSVMEEPLFPTYAFARSYKHGAILKRHRDRPACEISVTLNLYSEHDWPICIETPDGREVCITQKPGDGMLYLGHTADHWRDEKPDDSLFVQCFLHYVRSRGPYSWAIFDKEVRY